MSEKREMKYTTAQLREFQALPLERKVGITCARLTEFYTHFDGKVFVSFSGGKDSTVLLHIARKLFPDIPALFLNTGLEYPEIVEFVKTFDNVDIRRPAISFKKVIETEGYPVVSKEISQYIMEYRRYVEKLANGTAKKRKSPITEFEAIRKDGYFKYLEDALGGLHPPPEEKLQVQSYQLLPTAPRRKQAVYCVKIQHVQKVGVPRQRPVQDFIEVLQHHEKGRFAQVPKGDWQASRHRDDGV